MQGENPSRPGQLAPRHLFPICPILLSLPSHSLLSTPSSPRRRRALANADAKLRLSPFYSTGVAQAAPIDHHHRDKQHQAEVRCHQPAPFSCLVSLTVIELKPLLCSVFSSF
jgi:hypothetical protein